MGGVNTVLTVVKLTTPELEAELIRLHDFETKGKLWRTRMLYDEIDAVLAELVKRAKEDGKRI